MVDQSLERILEDAPWQDADRVAHWDRSDLEQDAEIRSELKRMQDAASIIPEDHQIERAARQEAKDAFACYESAAEDFLNKRRKLHNLDMLASDMEDGVEAFSRLVRIGEGEIQDTTGLSEEFIEVVHTQDRRVQDLQHQLYDAVARRKHLEDASHACDKELSEQRMALEMNKALKDGCSRNFEYFDDLETQQDVVTCKARDVAQECAVAAHTAMVRLDGINRIYLEESSLEVQRGIAATGIPAPRVDPLVIKDTRAPRIANTHFPFLGQAFYAAFIPQDAFSEDLIAEIAARNRHRPGGAPGTTGKGRMHLRMRGTRGSASGSRSGDFSEDTVYVTGIDYTLEPNTFLEHFEGSGMVDYVYWKLELDKDGRLGRHFAYIRYEDPRALDSPDAPGSRGTPALNRHGERLKGRILEVVRSNPTQPNGMMRNAPIGWSKIEDREDGTEFTRIWIRQQARRAGRI